MHQEDYNITFSFGCGNPKQNAVSEIGNENNQGYYQDSPTALEHTSGKMNAKLGYNGHI